MQVIVAETTLTAMLAAETATGPLFGRSYDAGDVLQVHGVAAADGELLGSWMRDSGASPQGAALTLLISPEDPTRPAAFFAGLPVPCQVVRYHTDYGLRVQGLFESDRLGKARVAVIGLGSGGSLVAAQLARCGVGALNLLDRDRVEVQNIARHACGLDDIGRYKARAMADLLRRISPLVAVEAWVADLLEQPEALRAAIAGCDLVVGATDSEQAKLAINRAAWAEGIPAVYGAAYNRAFGGDIFRALPPDGPCYECLHATVSTMFAPPPTAASDISPGYADPSLMASLVAEPGLVTDVTMIATLVTRAAIATLMRDTGSLADLPGNWTLFGNRAEWVFQHPLEGIFLTIERHTGCPVCDYEGYTRRQLDMSPEESRAAATEIIAAAEERDHG